MKTNRPNSILWFERLFFLSLAVTFVDLFYHREFLTGEIGVDEIGFGFVLIIIGFAMLDFGIQLLLWFFIAHRASSTARAIYMILWFIGLFFVFRFYEDYTMSEWVFLAIKHLTIFGSVIMLYGADAELWLETKGELGQRNGDDLKDVFR